MSEEMKPLNKFKAANTREQVDCPATSTESKDNPIWEYLMKSCSTENRETLAYVLRFANNTSLKAKQGDAISPEELRESEQELFKWTDDQYDTEDKKLIPASDEQSLLRSCGRSKNIRSQMRCLISLSFQDIKLSSSNEHETDNSGTRFSGFHFYMLSC